MGTLQLFYLQYYGVEKCSITGSNFSCGYKAKLIGLHNITNVTKQMKQVHNGKLIQ